MENELETPILLIFNYFMNDAMDGVKISQYKTDLYFSPHNIIPSDPRRAPPDGINVLMHETIFSMCFAVLCSNGKLHSRAQILTKCITLLLLLASN